MIEKYVKIWADLLAYNDMETKPRAFSAYVLALPLIIGFIVSVALKLDAIYIVGTMAGLSIIVHLSAYVYLVVGAGARASKVEEFLPDFLSLTASNIRAGLTPDKALIVSARPEFGPLGKAVDDAAKTSVTGMPLDQVMISIGEHIHSEVLEKTIKMIVEGLHSGGDMAELLEKTAYDLRKFRSVRREIDAIILNYVLFIMAAIAMGAPLLYAIASFLVEIMMKIKGKIGSGGDAAAAMGSVSIFKGKLAFTPEAITLFAALAITITVFFGCMTVGVMSSGKRMDGLKYFPLIWVIALGILFGIKLVLGSVLGGLMGG